jgi:hypothetical protein
MLSRIQRLDDFSNESLGFGKLRWDAAVGKWEGAKRQARMLAQGCFFV